VEGSDGYAEQIVCALLVVLGTLLTAPARADSASCAFSAGDLPAVTLPGGMPHGAAIPSDGF
jgi:hypothetical protein